MTDGTTFRDLPPSAAWRHQGQRDGFEVTFFTQTATGYLFTGQTVATEAGEPWAVQYGISLLSDWTTTSATIRGWSNDGHRELRLLRGGESSWLVDGAHAPHLDGCADVDLESSVATNTIPVHRLRLAVRRTASAPAVYVRAASLDVERLDQSYHRLDSDPLGGDPLGATFSYEAPRFDFTCQLTYDPSGLVLEYPGIAARVN